MSKENENMENIEEKNMEETLPGETISDETIEENKNSEKNESKKEAKELNPDEIIAQKAHRLSRALEPTTKAQKKKIFKSEHVVTEFGDEEIETDSTLLREDYLELLASKKSQKILEGTIIGFKYAGEVRKSTVLAELEFGKGYFSLLIPSYLLYDYDVSKYVDPDQLQTIENNIIRRFGSKVKFMVHHVDLEERQAFGDRLAAQSIIADSNYVRPTRDGKPRITEGMIVKAQVMYVVSKGMIVDALGCDIQIPKDEFEYGFVGDARQEYKAGDYVNVRVSNISEYKTTKNNMNYKLMKATGSVKAAKVDKRPMIYEKIKVGEVCSAKITYVEESGVFCRIKDSIDCLVALPRFGRNPERGDVRTIRITEKQDENMWIYGTFVNN